MLIIIMILYVVDSMTHQGCVAGRKGTQHTLATSAHTEVFRYKSTWSFNSQVVRTSHARGLDNHFAVNPVVVLTSQIAN